MPTPQKLMGSWGRLPSPSRNRLYYHGGRMKKEDLHYINGSFEDIDAFKEKIRQEVLQEIKIEWDKLCDYILEFDENIFMNRRKNDPKGNNKKDERKRL